MSPRGSRLAALRSRPPFFTAPRRARNWRASSEAALQERGVDGILFYSRRSASAFGAALQAARLAPLSEDVACFCLSAQAAEPVRPIAKGRVLVAEEPDQIHLFALVERAASSAEGRAR